MIANLHFTVLTSKTKRSTEKKLRCDYHLMFMLNICVCLFVCWWHVSKRVSLEFKSGPGLGLDCQRTALSVIILPSARSHSGLTVVTRSVDGGTETGLMHLNGPMNISRHILLCNPEYT